MERKHPDGRLKKDQPTVDLHVPPRDPMPFITPPTYLLDTYVPIALPDAQNRFTAFRGFRSSLLPDLLERGSYGVQDAIEEVDGAKCVVLRGTFEFTLSLRNVTEKHTTHEKLWLDPDRDLALRKCERTGSPGPKLLYRTVNSNFEEVAPGVWLPKETLSQTIAPSDDPGYPEEYCGKPVLSRRVELVKWIVNKVPDEVFEPYIKPGDHVNDYRGIGPALKQ